MACKDGDGNFVSADSVDALGEHKQERIPEEKVFSSYPVRPINIAIYPNYRKFLCYIYIFTHEDQF